MSSAGPEAGQGYYNRNIPVVKLRLMAAGVRLSYLLNGIYGPYIDTKLIDDAVFVSSKFAALPASSGFEYPHTDYIRRDYTWLKNRVKTFWEPFPNKLSYQTWKKSNKGMIKKRKSFLQNVPPFDFNFFFFLDVDNHLSLNCLFSCPRTKWKPLLSAFSQLVFSASFSSTVSLLPTLGDTMVTES